VKKRMVWLVMLALVCFACTALAAEERSISPKYEEMIVPLGKSLLTRYTVTPTSLSKAGVTFESSDESVATVNRQGYVKGHSLGQCELTIRSKRDPDVFAVLPLRVVIPVEKMDASVERKKLYSGETMQITCTYSPEDATLKNALFSSDRLSVATVDENGLITAHRRGKANITVTSADRQVKDTLQITVEYLPETVSFDQMQLDMSIGKKATLKASVQPSDAQNKRLVWSSSNEDVVSVNQKGQLHALKKGAVIIKAAAEADPSVSAKIIVNVKVPAQKVELDAPHYDVILGDTLQMEAQVFPENASDASLRYWVADPEICRVDQNGVLTGISKGKTTVTVTADDGSEKKARATVRVTVPVENVVIDKKRVRVGAGAKTYVSARIEPANATNLKMTWYSSDEELATVEGDNELVCIHGHAWGCVLVTGITEDGEYEASILVDVGNLPKAIAIEGFSIVKGRPLIMFYNRSDMHITKVHYKVDGWDKDGKKLHLGSSKDTFYGTYTDGIGADDYSDLIHVTPSDSVREELHEATVTITGWETDTGYYDAEGFLQDKYEIQKLFPTSTCDIYDP